MFINTVSHVIENNTHYYFEMARLYTPRHSRHSAKNNHL